jgi:Protein of unknown function DUF262/Protein of unknown function (DUF1524)
MAQTLVAHEQPIQKIFSDDYVFHIPDYQRPYAWTPEQARELIDDLLGFIEVNPGSVADMPSYFLGSIVLIKGDSPPADVVDGQQRLTTLTLLLAAIRANIDVSLRGNITKRLYEEGDPLTGTADRFRLTLRERDSEFFQRYVQKENGFADLLKLETALTDSRVNLRDNARFFQQRLVGLSETQRIQLASFILQRCYIVVVASSDETSAFRIFAVLNSRGLDLTATDILKAKLIGAIPEQQRENYTTKWEVSEEELGRDNFNSLFGHIRTVYSKAKAKEFLLKEFEQYVTDVKVPTRFIDSVLLPMAQAYLELTNSSYAATAHAESVNQHLKWLNRLEFTDWLPPALAFTVRHRENPEAMKGFVRDLERLSYCMLAIRSGINDRIERFAKVTRDVETGVDLSSEKSNLQISPEEQHRFYTVLDGPIYEVLSAKARMPILLRLDSLLSDGGAEYQYPIISVEHVLPQHPPAGSEWLEWFSSPELRVQWVNRLGNLVLLSRRKNSAASNFSFDVKKNTYFKRDGVSAFPLTTQVINEAVWDVAVVKKRQTLLMSRFEAHWKLQNRKSALNELMEDLK